MARLARVLLALGLCAAATACGAGSSRATVTILIPWGHDTGEYEAFSAVISRFKSRTGIQVIPEVTRAATQQLDAGLAAGDPPDVVDLANPGAVEQYKKKGLQQLRQVSLRHYAEPWRSLAMLDGAVYAVPVKADVKSLIWYHTDAVPSPPVSRAALENLSRRGTSWCLGLADGPASGWPGADWVADILLSANPPSVYTDWLAGRLAWKSAQVKQAWQAWGRLLRYGAAVPGGALGALRTAFNKAMPAGQCQLEHGALAATGLTSTDGYGYVPFPSKSGAASPVMVSGDFMGQFTDNPNAAKLLEYLASDEGQALWVKQPRGRAFSADTAVSISAYPSKVLQGIAGLLQPAFGTARCFAAGDMMTPDVSAAFSQAALEYINDHDALQRLLGGLQKTESGAGPSPLADRACSGR